MISFENIVQFVGRPCPNEDGRCAHCTERDKCFAKILQPVAHFQGGSVTRLHLLRVLSDELKMIEQAPPTVRASWYTLIMAVLFWAISPDFVSTGMPATRSIVDGFGKKIDMLEQFEDKSECLSSDCTEVKSWFERWFDRCRL